MYTIDWTATGTCAAVIVSAIALYVALRQARTGERQEQALRQQVGQMEKQVAQMASQVAEARKTYHVAAFLQICDRMTPELRRVRETLIDVMNAGPGDQTFMGFITGSSGIGYEQVRELCAQLNRMAFLSQPHIDAVPRDWVKAMWGGAIRNCWHNGAYGLKDFVCYWRVNEKQANLFCELECLAEECMNQPVQAACP